MSVAERSRARREARLDELIRSTYAFAVDPRKPTSGTSYSANGTLPVDANATVEIGSSAGGLFRERVPELLNRGIALATYDRMLHDDASVDVSLRAAKTGILGAEYFVTPFDEKPINQDVAEFVSYNLFEGTSQPFLIVLEEVMRMFEYGFSILEPVYETREWAPRRTGANRRKYTMLRKLAPRPAATIKKFEYDDNGGPVSILQGAINAKNETKDVTIPIEKLIIFTFNKKGGNLEGKSLLRTAYKHWYYKDNLYKIDAIQKERHSLGIPQIELPPNYTESDKTEAFKLVSNLRTNESAGIVRPPGWSEITFAKFEGQLPDVLGSIDHHEGRILLNVMVQFLLLGLQGGGGRATSGSHLDMFQKSLRHVANLVCATFNLYLIPRLVAYNFDTAGEFPTMQVRNIGETKDLQMWASAIARLIDANAITVDYEFEQWVRNIIDGPDKLGGKQTAENNPSGMKNTRTDNTTGDTSVPAGMEVS